MALRRFSLLVTVKKYEPLELSLFLYMKPEPVDLAQGPFLWPNPSPAWHGVMGLG
jgi:hypothetical protein